MFYEFYIVKEWVDLIIGKVVSSYKLVVKWKVIFEEMFK